MDKTNPINMMARSGARGNEQQIVQMAGMRGLMADPSGRTIEIPVRSNFREGLSVLEYFTSTHGTRKGLADTALRTAQSGYLTRRLVDVSQDVMVQMDDCGTDQGMELTPIYDGREVIEPVKERALGRYSLVDMVDPETEEVLVAADEMIEEEDIDRIEELKDKYGAEFSVKVRSPLTCETRHGVCAKCYGRDLATSRPVNIGEAVGIIAAESIGEPGTQMTMRTFHTGGVAGDDITQGLPRVEELFEARNPKGQALIADREGTVSFETTRGGKDAIAVIDSEGGMEKQALPEGAVLRVSEGDRVYPTQKLTEGVINPHDLLKIRGEDQVQTLLLEEIQRVYRMQGVTINDKHIEIVIRQMMKKVSVKSAGDTDLLPGSEINRFKFEEANEKAVSEGKEPATAKPLLLGITKAALGTDSFLSAASFQETTRVLTQAATEGAEDSLRGLKENVIIGKLIPAGTGMQKDYGVDMHQQVAGSEDTNDEIDGSGSVQVASDGDK